MLKIFPWLLSLGMASLALSINAKPSQANDYATAPVDYFQGRESIPLEIEPPTNSLPPNNNFGNFDRPLSQGSCPAILQPVIEQIVGAKAMKNWGILVETLQGRKVLYGLNENRYFIPASNNKIFTTAAALQRLDPQVTIGSKPLREWIMVINKHSDNGYAERVMRHLGGPGAVKSAITQLGVNPQSFRLADGSGLSRSNAATPRALVDTLQAMYYAPSKDLFVASLPVAGQNGTLSRRMKATPAEGNVHAKTGTLKGVRALSGYINNPTHGTLVFSILANDWSRSGTALVRAIDQVAVQLNTLGPCSTSP
ncbi:D-alanyl-D-alanine carboxypeptidase/D-alanyl-D-alanine-endopeptidase [Synechocystis sp. LKSZ1]|uniref:D-alanyl-D-alanine carboxypeptidase/D-alanyl-D-alanine endopeptidase n=1 Tax=Synechocystis sp. LKSZ1 TaxID=3144951 RepID=UPI00336BB787